MHTCHGVLSSYVGWTVYSIIGELPISVDYKQFEAGSSHNLTVIANSTLGQVSEFITPFIVPDVDGNVPTSVLSVFKNGSITYLVQNPHHALVNKCACMCMFDLCRLETFNQLRIHFVYVPHC